MKQICNNFVKNTIVKVDINGILLYYAFEGKNIDRVVMTNMVNLHIQNTYTERGIGISCVLVRMRIECG